MGLGLTSAVAGDVNRRHIRRTVWYVLGSVTGGAAVGLASAVALTTVGSLRLSSIAAGALAAAYGLAWLARVRAPMPSRHWQVPGTWYERTGDPAFWAYGAVLAAGFLTPIYFPTFYVLVILYGAIGHAGALAVGAYYGLLRAAAITANLPGPEAIPTLLARAQAFRATSNLALLLVAVSIGSQNV
jgi:hypothetical protein